MDDDASQAAVADFDRRVLGESAGASVRQVEPPDVPTSSTEGVPDGYVRPEPGEPAGSHPEPVRVGESDPQDPVVTEPGTSAYEHLDRAAQLTEAAERVAVAAETYAEAMKNAFLRLPNRARPYAEHAELLGALVAWHKTRAGD